MKIKLYVDGVLQEECVEEGFVVHCGSEKMSILNIFSGKDVIKPYCDKEFVFPNGATYKIRISKSPYFGEVCKMVKQYEGLTFVDICDGNVKLQIDF